MNRYNQLEQTIFSRRGNNIPYLHMPIDITYGGRCRMGCKQPLCYLHNYFSFFIQLLWPYNDPMLSYDDYLRIEYFSKDKFIVSCYINDLCVGEVMPITGRYVKNTHAYILRYFTGENDIGHLSSSLTENIMQYVNHMSGGFTTRVLADHEIEWDNKVGHE